MLLWALGDPERLEPTARAAIINPDHDVAVSAASLWEISIKQSVGRLRLPALARDWLPGQLEQGGFATLSITARHALSAGALPPHHRDPFDRMLVAQAIEESMTLVTSDAKLAIYGVSLLSA